MGCCAGKSKKQEAEACPEPEPAVETTGDHKNVHPDVSTAEFAEEHGKESVSGSKVGIYKQDPSVESVGYRIIWIPVDVIPGPRSDDVVILGMTRQIGPSDRQNNYIYSPDTSPEECDAVHTFTVVQSVMNMYRRALDRLGYTKLGKLTWEWGSAPILVFPHAGKSTSAYYDKGLKVLAFFCFDDASDSHTVYTCRSHDVVAHETGHAILDSLKPKFLTTCSQVETIALHEAFADLTAIFATLDHLDICQQVIADTNGNLHAKSFLPVIGEEFGKAMGRSFGMEGLRDSDLDLRVTDVVREAHNWSRVFTSAVYDILVRMYEDGREAKCSEPAETLYRAAKHLVGITLLGFIEAPNVGARFQDVAAVMVRCEANPTYKRFIKHEFERRLVFDKDARPKPWTKGGPLGSCSTVCVIQDEKLRDTLIRPLLPTLNTYVQGRPGV